MKRTTFIITKTGHKNMRQAPVRTELFLLKGSLKDNSSVSQLDVKTT